jgi:universal stress protein E
MIEINTIFAVIDPTTDKQFALQRAMRIARTSEAKIHAYLCISPTMETHDLEALERVERARYEPWLEKIVEEARAEGFDIDTELDWSDDWRTALGSAAIRAKSDFIVKASRVHSATERLFMTSSDISLIQTANCSVQLVSSEVIDDLYKVLISVDTKREDEGYQTILDSVIAYGKTVAATNEKGEVNAVYAYSGSENFEHVTKIAKRLDIDTNNVHIHGGNPEVAIAEVAKEVGAQMIIIGLSTKSSLKNRIFGNIVDKLLNSVEHDILVVIPQDK